MQGSQVERAIYRSKFIEWDRRATVRTKPRPTLAEEEDGEKLYFPPEALRLLEHPLVRKRGEEARTEILVQRLHLYLDFTAELEMRAVNPVCMTIGRGRSGFRLPPGMLEDAYKIYTDEAWHAQFSDGMQRQIVRSTGIAPALPPAPAFMERLAAVEQRLDEESRALAPLLFAIVSETLISAILVDIPLDERIHSGVRELVADHASDERIHHAFFSRLLQNVWPQLSSRQKAAAGPQLPELIRAFLDPDLAALAGILASVGISREEAGDVLTQSFDAREVAEEARYHGRFTVRHLARAGVLDDPATRDAFEAAGLLAAAEEAGTEILALTGLEEGT